MLLGTVMFVSVMFVTVMFVTVVFVVMMFVTVVFVIMMFVTVVFVIVIVITVIVVMVFTNDIVGTVDRDGRFCSERTVGAGRQAYDMTGSLQHLVQCARGSTLCGGFRFVLETD